jgi:hypothetical protein
VKSLSKTLMESRLSELFFTPNEIESGFEVKIETDKLRKFMISETAKAFEDPEIYLKGVKDKWRSGIL